MSYVTRTWDSAGPYAFQESGDTADATGIWFCTTPLHVSFINGIVSLQLYTESHHTDAQSAGDDGMGVSFDLVVLSDATSTAPIVRNGKELAWISHFDPPMANDRSGHFGAVFLRDHEMFAYLKAGDVIGVRLSRRAGRSSRFKEAVKGTISAIIDCSFAGGSEDAREGYSYTVNSTSECAISVKVDDDDLLSTDRVISRVWFTSPIMEKGVISRLENVQLMTSTHDQGLCDDPTGRSSSSWFDLAILDSPSDTTPRVKNGRALVWKSHENDVATNNARHESGVVFDRNHELFSLLEEGNVVAVMVSARSVGSHNHTQEGYLTVSVAGMRM